MTKTKVCKVCGVEKPLERFVKQWRNTSGVLSVCLDCYYARAKAGYEKLSEEEKERRRLERNAYQRKLRTPEYAQEMERKRAERGLRAEALELSRAERTARKNLREEKAAKRAERALQIEAAVALYPALDRWQAVKKYDYETNPAHREHRDEVRRAQQRRHDKNNPEKRREKEKRKRERNPERFLEKNRRYAARRKARLLAEKSSPLTPEE